MRPSLSAIRDHREEMSVNVEDRANVLIQVTSELYATIDSGTRNSLSNGMVWWLRQRRRRGVVDEVMRVNWTWAPTFRCEDEDQRWIEESCLHIHNVNASTASAIRVESRSRPVTVAPPI